MLENYKMQQYSRGDSLHLGHSAASNKLVSNVSIQTRVQWSDVINDLGSLTMHTRTLRTEFL